MKLKLSPRSKSQEPSGKDKRKQKSRQMSNLGVFITFLMISAVFWYIQSLEGTYQIRLNIPVTYDSLPGKTGYSISPPKSIEVVLTDKGLNLLDYKLKEFKPVHLEIQKGNNGQYLGISRKQLNATVMKQLSSTVQITSITPSEISIPLFRRESKKVPVHLNFEATTGQGFIAYRPQITPDSVTIYGSMEMLKNIKEVVAEDLPHEGLTASFEGDLRLPTACRRCYSQFRESFHQSACRRAYRIFFRAEYRGRRRTEKPQSPPVACTGYRECNHPSQQVQRCEPCRFPGNAPIPR
ncbi:CdaR family protein [Porphyromonas macacae]|uniref:CdaR family protein n=1 Tax=Porphyromonas macacae TaxID=28115 RepID=UPI00046AB60D|nr:YbbR-like domain-containing protein [Porphyromonas macacae]